MHLSTRHIQKQLETQHSGQTQQAPFPFTKKSLQQLQVTRMQKHLRHLGIVVQLQVNKAEVDI